MGPRLQQAWLLLALAASAALGEEACPSRCTCSSPRTVRCVFQKLTRVPRVPANSTVLDLRFNNIAELQPGDFHGLKQLHTLLLNDNRIRRLPASVFNGASSLRYVYLYKNAIEEVEPGAFAGLPRLEQLYLHGNQLRGFRAGTFSDLPRLERLYLQNNRLEHLPAEAFRNVGPMTKLRLDSNALVCDCELLWLLDRSNDRQEMAAVCQEPSDMKGRRLDDMTPADFHCSQPVIMEGPEDLELRLGERAEFRCRVTGDPRPSVRWMRDSNEVQADGEGRYEVREDGSLVISGVTEADAGEYECVAHNDMGSTKSRVARTLVVATTTPRFLETPKSQTVRSGTDVVLVCRAGGQSSTRVEWWREGSRLRTHGRIIIEDGGSSLKILAAKETDAGRYVCQLRNSDGLAETSADLSVVVGEEGPPRLVYQPQDMEVEPGMIVELPCRAEGQPTPRVTWKKDGTAVEGNRTRVSKHGSLYLYNVTAQDLGRYECTAVNEHGRARASALVRVRQSGATDGLVLRAFNEATREIDRAINNTLEELLGSRRGGLRANPFRLSRFPDAAGRRAARPADLFERALLHVRQMVDSGAYANATEEFRHEELLSAEQLRELERLSGCTAHRATDECLNLCQLQRHRTLDGKCNNLQRPTWGSSYTGFRRLLPAIYENGFSQPVGWDKSRLYHGFRKPAARLVSTSLIATSEITPDERFTHMLMQWGQWIDHDFDHALPAVSSESWGGIDCKKTCENAAPCFPMEVPPDDPRIGNRRCIDFFRTSAVCGSGMTSILWGKLTPREQLNQLTSYLDASQVYGYDEEVAQGLRDLNNDFGLLREGPSFPDSKPLLPYVNGEFIDCRRNLTESSINCFVAGDFRVNEQIGLTVMHTIWMREHNRLARRLRLVNPHWSGEKLYQEARKIVGAQMQVITYRDWIPRILGGASSDELFGRYAGYDPNLDASISNVFATAALRFGHSMIQPKLERLDANLDPIPQGPLHLRDAFFAPWRLVEEGGVDPLLRGMFVTPAKLKKPEQNLNMELTEQLFRTAHAVALDLAAMNIQRGRDHAIPPYTEWRKFCNMTHAETFDDLAGDISSSHVRQKLKELYGHPGNIDVWVGGILEDQLPNAKVGPLFKCLLGEQFKRMRDGDRFWYENPSTFRAEQLEQIKKVSLSRVLCDNGDNITEIQKDVFLLPDEDNDFLPCNEIPSIDLRAWSDCTEECTNQINLSNSISRSRRSAAKYLASANGYEMDKQESRSKNDKIMRIEQLIQNAKEDYTRVTRMLSEFIDETTLLLEEVKEYH